MQTIIGMFSHKEEAQKAVLALRREGFSPGDIRLVDQEEQALRAEMAQEEKPRSASSGGSKARAGMIIGLLLGALIGLLFGLGILALPGFLEFLAAGLLLSVLIWAVIGAVIGGIIGMLFRGASSNDKASRAAQQKMRDRTLVTVRADDTQANRVMAVMRSLNPLSIERTAGEWQAQPTAGFDLHAGPAAVPVTGQHASLAAIEEELQIDKRTVPGERTRISTYVETEPAEQDVALRQERIELERIRAERDVTDEDLQKFEPFVESSFEITEIVEIPYARKQATVVEEVRVSKTVEHKQEKVRETLRRQDVKVDKLPAVDWRDYERTFRQHYEKTFQERGQGTFQEYLPAYHFGFDLAQETHHADKNWNRLEPIAREQWQQRGAQTPWDEAKQAVRYAWETVIQTTR